MKTFLFLAFISCAFAASLPRRTDINYKHFELLMSKYRNVEAPLSTRASKSDMTYYFYSRNNENSPHVITTNNPQELSNSAHFASGKRTFYIVHGWVDSYQAEVNTLVKAALLATLDVNIIVVDWAPVADLGYAEAQAAVVAIGGFVAEFVQGMFDHYGMSGSQVTLIGHSLGAHICGNAGAALSTKVSHIIGLDPAAPSFTVANTQNRLDPSDAGYVQVIHTNGNFLGFSTSIGHADHYPNGGMVQAGCGLDLFGTCSHARAFQYLEESIRQKRFTSTKCGSYSDFQNNRCSANQKSIMGAIDVDSSVVGDYFLDTNTASPYAKG